MVAGRIQSNGAGGGAGGEEIIVSQAHFPLATPPFFFLPAPSRAGRSPPPCLAADKGAKMGVLHQLYLLLWKNVTLKRRSPVSDWGWGGEGCLFKMNIEI